jgi:hypothetical protein
MDWATDKTGEKLIYSIVMQEHARGLPSPARRGSGSYRFKKSLDAQGGLLGHKIFDAELEGDTKADTRLLLRALLNASAARIRWTGPAKDLITSIEVRENDIFSKKLIGLRITAMGMSDDSQTARPGMPLSGINFGVFDDFVPTNAEIATSPDVYGSPLIGAFKKQVFLPYADYTVTDFPRAQLMGVSGTETLSGDNLAGGVTIEENACIPNIDENVYLVDTESDLVTIPPPNQGDDYSGDETEPSEEASVSKYLNVRGTEKLGVKTHIKAFSTYGDPPVHLPWQVELPTIILESEYTLTRLSYPPPMMNFKMPLNAIVLDEQTRVDLGDLDSNGNRMYIRLTNRKIQFPFNSEVTNDLPEQSITNTWVAGDLSVTLKYYYTTGKDIHRPYDVRIESEDSITGMDIFQGTGANEFYPVDFTIPLGQS